MCAGTESWSPAAAAVLDNRDVDYIRACLEKNHSAVAKLNIDNWALHVDSVFVSRRGWWEEKVALEASVEMKWTARSYSCTKFTQRWERRERRSEHVIFRWNASLLRILIDATNPCNSCWKQHLRSKCFLNCWQIMKDVFEVWMRYSWFGSVLSTKKNLSKNLFTSFPTRFSLNNVCKVISV